MGRIYDQVFIDGTYTAGGCLLVASSLDHVIAWHWCTTESTAAYSALLDGITAPLIVVTDGGRGAASVINNCWPTTAVQRCLVHAQRIVRRHTTSRPRTNGGRAIYQLALNLTKITSLDQAAQWGQNQLAKVPILIHNENQADQETGRPALYDKAIDTAYNHSLSIRKGQL